MIKRTRKIPKPEIELKDVPTTISKSPFDNQDPIQRMPETTELGETIKELNADDKEKESSLSKIDMKSRLTPREVSLIMRYDTLVAIGLLPESVGVLTRIKKRLSVSLFGKGRDEIVEIVAGKREIENKKHSLGGMFSNWFKSVGEN